MKRLMLAAIAAALDVSVSVADEQTVTTTWDKCMNIGRMAEDGSLKGVPFAKIVDAPDYKRWLGFLADGPILVTCSKRGDDALLNLQYGSGWNIE
jgi:hypothetical protein